MIRALILASVLVAPALASPPPKGSEDYQTLAPYPRFVAGLKSCCTLADCRPVDAEIRGDHWAFHATPAHYGADVRDHWVTVPDSVIKRGANPTGRAVACYTYQPASTWPAPDGSGSVPQPEYERVWCFWPPFAA